MYGEYGGLTNSLGTSIRERERVTCEYFGDRVNFALPLLLFFFCVTWKTKNNLPQKNHWKDPTATPAIDRKIIDNAFFRLNRPE